MTTIEAIYDNGNIIFMEKPPVKKAKITVTFIEEIIERTDTIKFPTGDLGKMKNLNRSNLYEEYLSDRY
jgi:hypothetical protein